MLGPSQKSIFSVNSSRAVLADQQTLTSTLCKYWTQLKGADQSEEQPGGRD